MNIFSRAVREMGQNIRGRNNSNVRHLRKRPRKVITIKNISFSNFEGKGKSKVEYE